MNFLILVGPMTRSARLGSPLLILGFCFWNVLAHDATGHDIPDARVDRGIQVRLVPPQLVVEYHVSLSDWTLYQDLKALEGSSRLEIPFEQLGNWYGKRVGPLIARGVLGEVDGVALGWNLNGFEVSREDHYRYRFRFETDVPMAGHLRIVDTNYVSSRGSTGLAFESAQRVSVSGYEGPALLEEVELTPDWLFSESGEQPSDQLDLRYEVVALSNPTIKQDLIPDENNDQLNAQASDSSSNLLSVRYNLLDALINRASPLWLMMAIVLGATHALQPGHGKSVILASASGRSFPFRRSLILGISIAAGHLAVAVSLASLAVVAVPEELGEANRNLRRATGFLLALPGLWRLGNTLSGRQSGPMQGRSSESPESDRQALLLGLAIGIIPCWDAIMLLAIAHAIGAPGQGLALVTAFAVGSAFMMVGIASAARLLTGITHRVPTRWLDGLSASFLAGVGLLLLYR